MTSTNIAKILNIYPMKGAILVPGADADVVVWDPTIAQSTIEVGAQTQQSAIDYNVFEGMEVTAQAALHALSAVRSSWAYGQESASQDPRGPAASL